MLYELLKPGGMLIVPIKTHLVLATKDIYGFTREEKLLEVRYGDLVLPTKEEIREAELSCANQIDIPLSSFFSDIKNMFNNKFLSDVKFVVEEKIIYAHKSILASRSGYFSSFYRSGLQDSLSDQIIITQYTYNAYFEFVRFIYSDQCEINDICIAGELVGIAEYYRMEKLKALCEWNLSRSISIENACTILELANHYASHQLKLQAFDYIIRNFDLVKETKSFSKMEKTHVVQILDEALKRISGMQ
jgi:hypothetical protein